MNRRGFFGRMLAGLGGAVMAKYFSAEPKTPPLGLSVPTTGTFTVTASTATVGGPVSFRITDGFGNPVAGSVVTYTTGG